jgi:hypothetical protein
MTRYTKTSCIATEQTITILIYGASNIITILIATVCRKAFNSSIVVHDDKIYLFHMTLWEVVNQLALARHCDQRPSTCMPELPKQSIANTPYTKAFGLVRKKCSRE